MRLELGLNLKLSQQLRLAPQIIQSIEILQLPAMDLRELVENELQENEALELVDPVDEVVDTTQDKHESSDGDNNLDDGLVRDAENIIERLNDLTGKTDNFGSRASAEEASDRKLEAMQNSAVVQASLADHLEKQLDELELDADLRRAADAIVFNLDERGFLPCTFGEVAAGMDDPLSEELLSRALLVVQRLDPIGVGSRSLQECLLLQIRDEDPDADLKRTLLRDHFDDMIRNKRPRIAKSMGLEMADVNELVKRLGNLNMRPGAAFDTGPVRYIRPDVVIEWDNGEYIVRLINDHVPRVGISPRIKTMLEAARGDPKVREYLKRKLDSAKWLIEAIAQRQSTLERVAIEIVTRQRDYLEFGVNHLRPLKMQEVADTLGIHVSTVSRAISDKHAQTPRGIVPLKFFFTGGTENDDGGVESRLSVKERVRHIIDEEDATSPLSDDEVAERLKEQFGLEIARRTVTKYRKALDIPSSRQRRVWE